MGELLHTDDVPSQPVSPEGIKHLPHMLLSEVWFSSHTRCEFLTKIMKLVWVSNFDKIGVISPVLNKKSAAKILILWIWLHNLNFLKFQMPKDNYLGLLQNRGKKYRVPAKIQGAKKWHRHSKLALFEKKRADLLLYKLNTNGQVFVAQKVTLHSQSAIFSKIYKKIVLKHC